MATLEGIQIKNFRALSSAFKFSQSKLTKFEKMIEIIDREIGTSAHHPEPVF